ncbi:ACT domain-containing protein [Streptomyces sp. NPDC126503]|uniref:ACT domain-containing protein n=1 Tax=Streptomyces sp. NPDC126503 TaxID=3155315 RepID=UPI003317E5CB
MTRPGTGPGGRRPTAPAPPRPERDLGRLLAGLRPLRNPGAYVFTTVDGPVPAGLDPVVTVTEAEGRTLVVRREEADAAGLAYDYVAAWITLRVHSALDAVGLTAAVARALAAAGLSCNVVAGFHHDHLFVEHDSADEALGLLRALADRSCGGFDHDRDR